MKKSCFTCGSDVVIKRKSLLEKPVACSKECKTLEFKHAVSDWMLKERGFPPGFSCIEKYQKYLKNNEIIDKICKECGIRFQQIRKGNGVCSPECVEKQRVKKIAATKELRFGSASFNNREKAKETCIEKYGVDNPMQDSSIKEKAKETCIEKYGVDNASKDPKIIEKIAESHFRKYGVRNVFQRRDIMEEAYERAFGVGITNPQQVPEISEKTAKTRAERYDLQGAVPREKLIETNLRKYNAEQFFSSDRGKMTDENLINSFGKTPEEVREIREKTSFPTKEVWISRFGDSEESLSQYNKRLAQCDSSSYDWALSKSSGDEILADEIYKNRQIKNNHKPGVGSKLSLKLFKKFEIIIREKYNIDYNDIYVGDERRKEYFLYNSEQKTIYFYDFTIRSKKIIIEFNGCFYHPKTRDENPERFDRDKCKIDFAKQNGFEVFIVWDDKSISENLNELLEKIECSMNQN